MLVKTLLVSRTPFLSDERQRIFKHFIHTGFQSPLVHLNFTEQGRSQQGTAQTR